MVKLLLHRLLWAITTLPDWAQTWQSISLAILIAVLILPIGLALRFLHLDLVRSRSVIGQAIAVSLVMPALLEEIVFRVILLPHPSEPMSSGHVWLWAGFGLILFILYHPLNAWTCFPAGKSTFTQPSFLLLAALLGSSCTLAYLKTGSVWLPVFIHWLAVIIWLLVLGGYRRLYAKPDDPL